MTNVEPDFWSVFQKAAGIYAVGEVSDSDVALACPYQDDIDGLLNYPMCARSFEFEISVELD